MAQAIHRTDALKLITCYSRTMENRAQFAETFECIASASFDEAINHPSVEGVLLTTPNKLHAEQAIECARAGKHVFVEKPIADSLKESIR